MKRSLYLLLALAGGVAPAFSYGVTFVSVHGADSAVCGVNFGTPCFSLAQALQNTDPGGLIKVMDANAYAPGGLIINKPITIEGSGFAVLENIFAPGTPVLQIQANCTIRGIVIQVTLGDAIQLEGSGLRVHLEDVTIQGVAGAFGNGVLVNSAGNLLTANNVTIAGATNGFNIEASTIFSGEHLHISHYVGIGIETQGGSATLRDSVIAGPGSGTGSIGIYVTGFGGTTGTFLAERSEVSGNGTGVEADNADSPGTLRISDMVITGNGTGLLPNNGGQIISFRTNMIAGNGTDGTPSLGTSLK